MIKPSISFNAIPEFIKEKGVICVELHFKENAINNTFNNMHIRVFVEASLNNSVTEIENKGIEEAEKYLQRIKESL